MQPDITAPFDPKVDNEPEFMASVMPLLEEIRARCRKLGIPFLATFQYAAEMACTAALILPGCAEDLGLAYKIITGQVAVGLVLASPEETKPPVAKA